MPIVWVLIIVLGLLCGALYHLVRGKSFKDLGTYLLAGVVGLALGHKAGGLFLPNFPLTLGDLHIFEGFLGSVALLILVEWLKI